MITQSYFCMISLKHAIIDEISYIFQQEFAGTKLVKYDIDTEQPIRGADGRLIECAFNEPGMVVMRTSEIHQFSDMSFETAK